MTTSFNRTRSILRAALHTLRQNPRLMWFPVLSGLATIAMLLACAMLFGTISIGGSEELAARSKGFAGFIAYFGVHVIGVLFGVGLTHATLEALGGREWTIRGSLQRARMRIFTVVGFAAARAFVGRTLRRMQRRRGTRLPGKLAETAWWAATYLTLPVIAREDRGSVDSIVRSAELFKQTWKETFLGRLALGWFWFPFVLIIVLPLCLCAGLGIRDEIVWAAAVGIPAALAGAACLFIATLGAIYKAALYVYATEGVVPTDFDVTDLHEVWHTK